MNLLLRLRSTFRPFPRYLTCCRADNKNSYGGKNSHNNSVKKSGKWRSGVEIAIDPA